MIPALSWAVMRAILMFQLEVMDKVTGQCPQTRTYGVKLMFIQCAVGHFYRKFAAQDWVTFSGISQGQEERLYSILSPERKREREGCGGVA